MPHLCPDCKHHHILRFTKAVIEAYQTFKEASPEEREASLMALAMTYVDETPAHDVTLDEDTHEILEECRGNIRETNRLLMLIGRTVYTMLEDYISEDGTAFSEPPCSSPTNSVN